MRVDPSGAFAVPLARRNGRGLWRQPWKIGNFLANLLIAALIGATSALGLGCAARLVACKVKRDVRNGKIQKKALVRWVGMGQRGGTLDQIQPLDTAKGRGAVKRRSAAACGVRATNPAIVATQCKQGRSASRGGIARELRRARNRGQKRARAAARGATLGQLLPVIELRRSAKELKRQTQCGCSMEGNAGGGGSLCVPQIIELFCLNQGQKKMTFNCESNFIYFKTF